MTSSKRDGQSNSSKVQNLGGLLEIAKFLSVSRHHSDDDVIYNLLIVAGDDVIK